MKAFSTTIAIDASPAQVWGILTAGEQWTSWNTTVSRLDGRIEPGGKVKVWVKANPGRAFALKVVEFEAPRRMVWSGGMPFGLFKGERTYTLAPRGGGGTQFAMTEQFTGALAPMIGKSIPDLQPAFDEFARCLKQRAEQ